MPVELFEVIHKDIDIVTVAVQMDEEGWEERFALKAKIRTFTPRVEWGMIWSR